MAHRVFRHRLLYLNLKRKVASELRGMRCADASYLTTTEAKAIRYVYLLEGIVSKQSKTCQSQSKEC